MEAWLFSIVEAILVETRKPKRPLNEFVLVGQLVRFPCSALMLERLDEDAGNPEFLFVSCRFL